MICTDYSSGPVLAEMLGAYTRILFEGSGGLINDIQKIPTQADILTQIAGERASEAALDHYQNLMQVHRLGFGTLDLCV